MSERQGREETHRDRNRLLMGSPCLSPFPFPGYLNSQTSRLPKGQQQRLSLFCLLIKFFGVSSLSRYPSPLPKPFSVSFLCLYLLSLSISRCISLFPCLCMHLGDTTKSLSPLVSLSLLRCRLEAKRMEYGFLGRKIDLKVTQLT